MEDEMMLARWEDYYLNKYLNEEKNDYEEKWEYEEDCDGD
jgi:hypothetical protein